MLTLDPIQTVALAACMLALGYWLTERVALLRENNIPAPIVGGLIIALLQWGLHELAQRGLVDGTDRLFTFSMESTTFLGGEWKPDRPYAGPFSILKLSEPFSQMFFASLGFGASIGLLRIGGPQVVRFFLLACGYAVLQNLIGIGVAWACGRSSLFGIMCGSVTLTGGPATGIAWSEQFAARGLENAKGLALASSMGGIICGGLLGGPLGKRLVAGNGLRSPTARGVVMNHTPSAEDLVERQLDAPLDSSEQERNAWSTDGLLKAFVALLCAMGLGMILGPWLTTLGKQYVIKGFELPSFIGAMFVAVCLRNLDDLTGWFRFSQRLIDDLGSLALGIFITLTLMDLKLWELAADAGALFFVLLAQALALFVFCLVAVFRTMGKDYEAAVMSGGFYGFMMGTTANSMAAMRVLVERYGPAPRAFLVVPIVGAFLIDAANLILVTGLINVFQ